MKGTETGKWNIYIYIYKKPPLPPLPQHLHSCCLTPTRREARRCTSVHAIKNTWKHFDLSFLERRRRWRWRWRHATGPRWVSVEATVSKTARFSNWLLPNIKVRRTHARKDTRQYRRPSATPRATAAHGTSPPPPPPHTCHPPSSLWSARWPSKQNVIVYCFTPPWTTFTSANTPDAWIFFFFLPPSVAKQQARPKYPSNGKQIWAVNEHAKESTSNGRHCSRQKSVLVIGVGLRMRRSLLEMEMYGWMQ